MNITKVHGSYSKELLDNINRIKLACTDNQYSLSGMRSLILDIIEPAFIGTVAKQRFINYLSNCRSKKEVYSLCWNTIQKAMDYNPARTY